MASDLTEILNSINTNKTNLMVGDNADHYRSAYVPYVVNHCMMAHIDTVLIANELNRRPWMQKDEQYVVYLNMVNPRKRFAPWLKTEKIEDLDIVKEYYGLSTHKAKEAMKILTQDEIQQMKVVLDRGGVTRRKKT